MFLHYPLFSSPLSWGEIVKTDINKDQVNTIIKEYVNKKYPKRVHEFHLKLQEQTNTKLAKIRDVIFIKDDLMWQDQQINSDKKLNRLELKLYCKRLNLANRKDWRVPKYDELLSLVDYKLAKPAALKKIKYIKPLQYWTSTVSVKEKDKNWFVDFKYGTSGISLDTVRYNIRCVRDMAKEEGTY